MNGLRSHTKNSKECFIRSPNTSKSVKETRLRLVFSTHFSGFGYPDETLFLVFDILHPYTEKWVEKTSCSSFSTDFEVFGYLMKHFDTAAQTTHNTWRNSKQKFTKFYAN